MESPWKDWKYCFNDILNYENLCEKICEECKYNKNCGAYSKLLQKEQEKKRIREEKCKGCRHEESCVSRNSFCLRAKCKNEEEYKARKARINKEYSKFFKEIENDSSSN